jgi:hypothetical protein
MIRSQFSPQYLSNVGLWQAIAELDALGYLIGRQSLLAVATDLSAADLPALSQHHPSLDGFASETVGDTGHIDLSHRRVRSDRLLHFPGPDQKAAGLAQVLLAIDGKAARCLFVESKPRGRRTGLTV